MIPVCQAANFLQRQSENLGLNPTAREQWKKFRTASGIVQPYYFYSLQTSATVPLTIEGRKASSGGTRRSEGNTCYTGSNVWRLEGDLLAQRVTPVTQEVMSED